MANANVFGAVRATTIAALCAGAGIALAACSKSETAPTTPATEKPATEMSCGADKKCGQNACGISSDKNFGQDVL